MLPVFMPSFAPFLSRSHRGFSMALPSEPCQKQRAGPHTNLNNDFGISGIESKTASPIFNCITNLIRKIGVLVSIIIWSVVTLSLTKRVPCYKQGAGNKNRRVDSGTYANNQRQRKVSQRFPSKKEQSNHCKQCCGNGADGPA